MRTVILILIVAVVALIGLFATNLLNVNQTQEAVAPSISADGNGVTATGGQPPEFKVETGSVSVGTKPTNVTVNVPTVSVNDPAATPANTANAQ